MDGGRSTGPAITAGVLAGVAGLLTFLLIHHVWIEPIWFIAPAGAIMAAVGGTAVGAAYVEIAPGLPDRPWRGGAMAAVWAAVLLPAIILAEFRGPIFAMDEAGGGSLLVPPAEAAADVLLGLFATAAVVGTALGLVLGRTRRAGATMALAAVVLAAGPGHNIPLLGGTAAVGKELTILGAVVVVASVVLVRAEMRLQRPVVDDAGSSALNTRVP